MKRVLLGLGSNRSFDSKSPLELLKAACENLESILQNPIFSSVYRTKAMYVEDQDDFYNMAALGFVDDSMTAFELLDKIHVIEAQFGRDRSKEIRFGPRPLDIDIELFGRENINTAELQIPHIRVKERAFVMVPALEILDKSADKTIREEFNSALKLLNVFDKDGKSSDLEKLMSFNELKVLAVRNGKESTEF